MTKFTTELSGSIIFNSGSSTAELQPYSGGLNISGSELYINEVGLDTRLSNVESGFAGSASLGPLNTFSASANLRVGALESSSAVLNTTTGSLLTGISNLRAVTGSYIVTSSGLISSSAQISASGFLTSASAANLGFGSGGSSVPAGTISSSTQIEGLGFVTSSDTAVSASFATSASYILGSNIDGTVGSSTLASTASFINSTFLSASIAASGFGDANLPAGTVSSSIQIEGLGFITSSNVNTASFVQNSATASFVTNSQTGSYVTNSQTSSFVVNSQTGSFITADQTSSFGATSTGSLIQAASASNNIITFTKGDQTTFNLTVATGSGGGAVTYDGNRIISQQLLPSLFTSSFNPGTSGSVQEFLNAVFYPNTGPSFTSGTQFNIAEFTTSGSIITTLTATDPEGQALTFATQAGYTDNFVKVSSTGVVTLNTVPTTANFNTVNRGDGELAHPVLVKVTDTFNGTDTATLYIDVTANSAPVFRQTSIGGSIITSFATNRNENQGTQTNIGRIFFTDTNSDAITITSQSDNTHFELVKESTYVQINQLTSSLDYENTPTYTMSITASDAHYEAGQDTDASSSLTITLNVTDNLVPIVNNQTLSSINENSANGAVVGTIAASDNESDSITFSNFTLSSVELDGTPVSTGSYSGTSQASDPHENPFQMDSSGNVTRKVGVYLNSDILNNYKYTVQVRDNFNTLSSPATITIPIADDTPATLTDNWSAGPYIVESDTSSTSVKSSEYGSTTADYNSNQSGTFTSSNASLLIGSSNGNLSIATNLSGSVTQSGDTIGSTITFTNTFGTTTTDSLTVSVLGNRVPTASFTQQSPKFNTNLGVAGTTLFSGSISDLDGDVPFSASLTGTNANLFEIVYNNADSSSFEIKAISDVPAGTYDITASVFDNYAESQQSPNSETDITINQAPIGALTTNGTFYIIESVASGSNIVINSNGRTGTQGDLGVTYSPSYGSAAVASFTSSNSQIAVSTAGALSVAFDVSGSGTGSGDTISSNITFRDQYNNIGSGSISVNVTTNTAPDIIFADTSANHNTNLARSGSILATLTFSDTESDTINYAGVTFEGTGSQINAIQVGTSWRVQAKENLSASIYSYTASVQDNHQFNINSESDTITIAAADNGTLNGDTSVYIIESAISGSVYRDATGYNNGNTGQVGVSYSPSYGTPTVQSFTSSNAAIGIDASGNLSLGVTLSGSVTQSGDTFSSTITFRDQYDNIGSGSITATVFGNQSPSANFTGTSNYESDAAVSGSTAGTLAVTDTESNSPFSFTLAGTNGDKFNVAGTSSPFTIQPTGSLIGGTYTLDITITDSYNESVTLSNESIYVTQSVDYGKVFIYSSTLGSDSGLTNAYTSVMGIGGVDSSVPPQVTSLTASTGSLIARFVSGSLGDSTINLSGGTTATLLISASGAADIDTVLSSSIGTLSTSIGNGQVVIIYPSGSSMGVPTSIQQSFNSTAGGVVPAFNVDGNGYGIEGAKLHSIVLNSTYLGFDEWFVVGRTTKDTIASNIVVRLVNSSGSLPS